jgi:hypothetical protein
MCAEEQRHQPRRLINIAARSGRGASAVTDVRVLDLSPGGCKVTPANGLRTGDQLWLKLPGLEALVCTVAWVHETDAGCSFARHLDPGDVELVHLQVVIRRAPDGAFGRKGLSGTA